MQWIVRVAVRTAGLAALAACGAGLGPPPATLTAPSVYWLPPNVARACPAAGDPSIMRCLALIRTDVGGTGPLSGYAPSDLRSAYGLPSASQGAGQTVALVDAYDDPNAAKDLSIYRKSFGLSACKPSNGCFRKVNQRGHSGHYPIPNSNWAIEESLDIEMVSAICPNCKIILVEANNPSPDNLGESVDEAVALGANVVSNSYYGFGLKGSGREAYYDHPGTIITASAGDQGYGVAEPAGYPTVVSVGGTKLVPAHNPRKWIETVWVDTGSGCEARLAKPVWQLDPSCVGRTMNDVAALADPRHGVAVYDSYYEKGWIEVGGTSVGAPLIGSVYALAGNAALLNAAESLYAPGASLWDVTSGSNGTCSRKYLCNAKVGYDGPTGNGTPNGISAF